MSKLLSNSYEREWHEQNRTKQAEQHGEAPTMVKEEKTVQGEHNTNDGHSPPTGATRSGRRNSGPKAIAKNTQSSKKKEDELKKEPFKLSKFKNVPARVDTHQIPEVLAAVGH
ncbi:hypothetical protein C0Q70_01726 [Pomacea canaliculata]|uniref:Uncharacterized protein n=1 Tax=Pomacea canaliculata TaxID=400727 RepID=A0A2T7Q0A3_POMCA|nr:hypothetical protein C0Q70_01726 [Pomacea canaliculata]